MIKLKEKLFNIFMYNYNLPRLDIGNRIGFTRYIDFISWKEVKYPVMKGIDTFGRQFIVIKCIVNNVKIMQTFFQRYSNENLWMGCGHATQWLINTQGGMTDNQKGFIDNIICGKSPIIKECHCPVLMEFIGEKVELYDENKINACVKIQKYWRKYLKRKEESAIKIQKQWKKTRYNPTYNLCKQIKIHQLEECIKQT